MCRIEGLSESDTIDLRKALKARYKRLITI